MTRRRLPSALAAAAGALLLTAGAASADPPANRVEVVNDGGARVGGLIQGPDAVQAAVARVRNQRGNPNARWTIVIGRGTYGDFDVNTPNLTVRSSAGAQVVIDPARGGTNVTGGGCMDVTRGGLIVGGLICRNATGNGIDVRIPGAEAFVLLNSRVERAGGAGIVVAGGGHVQIENTVVAAARGDGIRLARLTGPGPYLIRGGAVRGSGEDGIDLADDVQRLSISGVTVDNSADMGIESDDAGNAGVQIDSVVVTRSGRDGVLLAGNGTGLALTNSQVSFNGRWGVNVGAARSPVLRGVRFDGSNSQGDLRFSQHVRTGGAYDTLTFVNTLLDLPGEPNDVVVDAVTEAQRAQLSPLPAGFVSFGRTVRVRDGGAAPTSGVTLRFRLAAPELVAIRRSTLAVFEDDPPANNRLWEPLPTLQDPAGPVSVTLTDAGIASGSNRFATYAPLGQINRAPSIAAVYPAPGSVVRGRNLIVGANVGDDERLGANAFRLTIDGRRKGGVSLRNGVVRFRVGRLPLGRHTAVLQVADPSGLRTVRRWRFTIRNLRPTIVRPRALPRPGSFVLTRGVVRIRIPLRDDDVLSRLRGGIRIDGRAVRARVVRGRLVANVRLPQGRHRLAAAVRDRDGAKVIRSWFFRTVTP